MNALTGHWYIYSLPFRHYRASEVLQPDDYIRVCNTFKSILEPADPERAEYRFLAGLQANYDARMLSIGKDLAASFAPFLTRNWIDALATLLGLPNTGRIDAGLHSSPPGSRTGWIHTDLCSGWFDERSESYGDYDVPGKNGVKGNIRFPSRRRCNYFTGASIDPNAHPKEYIRAATLIYYLCNDDWQPGFGGETAVYGSATDSPFTNRSLIPPLNNTLLLFECSPHSWHRFISNPGCTRNSLILWLHTSPEYATEKWGSFITRRNMT